MRAPKLRIIWEQAADLQRFEIPETARIFARERHEKAPLVAGFRRGSGAVLWIATSPGPHGYERFPYLPQALADLGLEAPFRSAHLWAFFDSAYRSHVDLDYFAPRWRQAGISALHVAAWHYWEPDPQADEYLRHLIDACHRNAIQVYAWIELPHVSDRFWDQHPEWREKTALQQDAQLDWRKLMNLTNREAFAEAARGRQGLMNRFDWDGVNLAELYFESLEGHENPARFTPMNDDVRGEFRAASGGPLESIRWICSTPSRLSISRKAPGDGQVPGVPRGTRPPPAGRMDRPDGEHSQNQIRLDLTLTHIDDRFDTSMREKIGADTRRCCRCWPQHDFTFLIEDPATVWNLGPQRYPQIAARYAPLTPRRKSSPSTSTSSTGIRTSIPPNNRPARNCSSWCMSPPTPSRASLCILKRRLPARDLPLLPSAAAAVRARKTPEATSDDKRKAGGGIAQRRGSAVEGFGAGGWEAVARGADTVVWLMPGPHVIQPAAVKPVLCLIDFNGDLHSVAGVARRHRVRLSEFSAMALLEHVMPLASCKSMATESHPVMIGNVLMLPRGQHFVRR